MILQDLCLHRCVFEVFALLECCSG